MIGIFIYGIVVFGLVCAALGLLAWGIVNERRDRTRFEQGREVFGDGRRAPGHARARGGAEVTGLLDRALDLAVIPGYSRIGYRAARPALGRRVRAARSAAARPWSPAAAPASGRRPARASRAAGARVHMLVRDRERGERRGLPNRIAAAGCDAARSSSRSATSPTSPRCGASPRASRRAATGSTCWSTTPGCFPRSAPYSPDGVELTFATNVLGPFLLTSLLLPALLAAAPSRVITVSSGGMYTARLDADDLQLERRRPSTARASTRTPSAPRSPSTGSGRSSFPADRIAFHAMHPGWVDTPGLRSSLPRFRRLMRPLLRDARQGADTVVWLGTQPDARAGDRRLLARPRTAPRAPPAHRRARPPTSASGSGGSASASARASESPERPAPIC